MQTSSAGARWLRPVELGEALRQLRSGGWTVLAGGTDLYPGWVGRPVDDAVLDISGLETLRGVSTEQTPAGQSLRIGALTTWSELARATLPRALDALAMAAREVGGIQIQNRGTVGGNLCNASPAADGVPALLALDATVELASSAGVRRLAVGEYVLGSRRTARRADELLTAVVVPCAGPRARSLFLKLGHRRYLVISIAMAGIALEADAQGRIERCAVAVGACSPAARRLTQLEERVRGMAARDLARDAQALLDDSALAPLSPLSPIDDLRGTARYRRAAVSRLIARGLAELATELAA